MELSAPSAARPPRSPMDLYLELRERVTNEADSLFARYRSRVACKRGCYFCCDPITVLPIEIAALRNWVEEHGAPDPNRLGGPPDDNRPRCRFLGKNGECTVYEARPLICRTHGLPLSYRVYEYDMHGREIGPDAPHYTELWCDLNFTDVPEEEIDALFDEQGKINMHLIHEATEALNDAFLMTIAGSGYAHLPPGEDRMELIHALSRRTRSPGHRSPAAES